MRWFIIPILLLSFNLQGQQIQFNKFYPRPNSNGYAFGIVTHELPSGNLLSFFNWSEGSYILKTDPFGSKIWDSIYNDNHFAHTCIKKGNNFLLAGNISQWNGYGNIFIRELDSTGKIIWQTETGRRNEPVDFFGSIKLLESIDGGFLLLIPYSDPWWYFGKSTIMFFNSVGDSLHSKTINDKIHGIYRSLDSGYIIVGSDSSLTTNGNCCTTIPSIKNIGENGDIIWERKYPELFFDAKDYNAVEVIALDSTYLVAFTSWPVIGGFGGPDRGRGSLFEFSKEGDTIKRQFFENALLDSKFEPSSGNSFVYNPISLIRTPDGGFLVSLNSGYCYFTCSGHYCDFVDYLHLSKWNKNFSEEWELSFKKVGAFYSSNNISITKEGSYLLTGHSDTVYHCPQNTYVDLGRPKIIRIDSLGNTTVDIEHPISDDQKFHFYPNPASSRISIEHPESYSSIALIDLLGYSVYKTQDLENIDLTHVPNGLYIIKAELRKSGNTISRKILIQH